MSRARPLSSHRFAPRPRLAPLALLSALALGSACKGESNEHPQPGPEAEAKDKGVVAEPAPPIPTGALANTVDSAPIAERGDVIATAQLPSGTQLSDISAVIESIQPGASMLIQTQLPGLLDQATGFDLAHAKLDAPISIVILNPSAHDRPFALLVEAKDSAALIAEAKTAGHEAIERDGRLLIGPPTVIAAAQDFAFTNLTKYPDHSEFIVYPGLLLNVYADQIAQGLDEIATTMAQVPTANEDMTKMLRAYAEGVVAVARQTDRVVFSVNSAAGSADLVTRIYPVEDSMFASFVAAQIPADHALLGQLPAETESGMRVLVSGDLRAGEARDPLVAFGIEFMTLLHRGASSDEWKAISKRWLDSLDGRFAMSMTVDINPGQAPAMNMLLLWGTTDSDVLRKVWREMLTLMAQPNMDMMGMKVGITYEPDAFVYDDVSVDLYATSVDPSSLPADQRAAMQATASMNQKLHVAAFDEVAVVARADESNGPIKAAIDASRGRGEILTPTGDFKAALAMSKAHGDSALMYFDISKIPGAAQVPFRAFAMSMGKDGDALGVRISLRK